MTAAKPKGHVKNSNKKGHLSTTHYIHSLQKRYPVAVLLLFILFGGCSLIGINYWKAISRAPTTDTQVDVGSYHISLPTTRQMNMAIDGTSNRNDHDSRREMPSNAKILNNNNVISHLSKMKLTYEQYEQLAQMSNWPETDPVRKLSLLVDNYCSVRINHDITVH